MQRTRLNMWSCKMEKYILILYFIVLGSALNEKRSTGGCRYTSMALICEKVSGKFLDPETTTRISHLYIIKSNLQDIKPEDLSAYNSLEVIAINQCLTFASYENLFEHNINLKTLKITKCNVSEDVGILFSHNAQIVKLYLSGNKISAIKKNLLGHLKSLEEVDLSENHINHIEVGAFEGLPSLQILDLSNNKIGEFFHPAFLNIYPYRCAICTNTNENDWCSNDDFDRCHTNLPIDELWSTFVIGILRLKNNPVCETITEERVHKTAVLDANNDELSSDQCVLYGNGRCYRHESRRYFLLEACEVSTDNPGADPTLYRTPVLTSDRQNDSISFPEDDLNVRKYTLIMELFSIIGFTILIVAVCFGGIVIGLIFGPHIRKCLTSVGNGVKKQNAAETCASFETNHLLGISVPEETLNVSYVASDSRNTKNTPSIFIAARQGDTELLCSLLEPGGNENLAFQEGYESNESLLMSKEALVHARDHNGDTPLHVSVRARHVGTTEMLLRYGGNIDIANNDGDTSVHLAAMSGQHRIMEMLLYKNPEINLTNRLKNTPLHLAVQKGSPKIVKQLLTKGADPNILNANEDTAVNLAVKFGHCGILKSLLQKGGRTNVKTKSGDTMIHLAALKGRYMMIDMLLNHGIDINAVNNQGETAAMKAAQRGHMDTLKKLLECGADPQLCCSKGYNVILYATQESHPDVVDFILGLRGNGNYQLDKCLKVSSVGDSLLHMAVRRGSVDVVKVLLSRGADPNVRNTDGESAKDIAQEIGPQMVNLLNENNFIAQPK